MTDGPVLWVVRGRVQGVGFRHFTIQAARALGVRGTVRNVPDGTVEVRAAGPAERLEALCERLRRGPPSARVASIDATELPGDVELPDRFEARY